MFFFNGKISNQINNAKKRIMQNNCREKFGGMKKTLYLCNECATTV